ncbi:LacI family transcriptional regulator [Cohnella fermenti]|uniref:LacI family transcriptional regulator n=2 Tax=Cohnella fermenti TaxID=2565925 RepID=A0A4S4C899_9BACL|nr:LacI family transcriptional regulator [Cohnella fermenti]
MTSIKDIAKKAGVSISTVSYALNGSERIMKETAERILAIADELGYVPHGAARRLKKRESMLVGIYLTNYGGHFYGSLLQGVKDELNRRGYDLIVCSGMRSHRLIPERTFDGTIVLDSEFTDEELLDYAERGHKLVVLDRELAHPHINQVLLDNKAGASLAMEHLLEQGYERIYVVGGPEDAYDARQRLRAVRQVMDRSPGTEFRMIPGSFQKKSGYAAGKTIADEYDRPSGVFCLNDEMAIGLYEYLEEHTSLQVGEHVHLIGFDNIEPGRYMRPKLATIDYSLTKWGAVAAEQLLKLIDGEPLEPERVYVRLVEGGSVRPLPDKKQEQPN